MMEFRLKALEHYLARPMPGWGADISGLDLDSIYYYVKPSEMTGSTWDEVPDTIKKTFDKLGVPEAERKFLAGVGAQYESEMVYHSIQKHLEEQGSHLPEYRRWACDSTRTCSSSISTRSFHIQTINSLL